MIVLIRETTCLNITFRYSRLKTKIVATKGALLALGLVLLTGCSIEREFRKAGGELVQPRSMHNALYLNDNLIFISGSEMGLGAKSAEIYNIESDKSVLINAKMNYSHSSHQSYLLPNKKIIFIDENPEIYDPATNTFQGIKFLHSRFGHASAQLSNGKIIVVGGASPRTKKELATTEILGNPENGFQEGPRLRIPLPYAKIAVLENGDFYVASPSSQAIDKYSVNHNRFSLFAENPLYHRVNQLELFLIKKRLFIMGVQSGSGNLVYCYLQAAKQCEVKSYRLPKADYYKFVPLTPDLILIAADNPLEQQNIFLFSTRLNKIVNKFSRKTLKSGYTITPTSKGKVFFMGGRQAASDSLSKNIEIYQQKE